MLRHATEAAHRNLHGHPAFAALLRGELSRHGYAQLLLRLLGLHAPIDRQLRRHDGHSLMAWRRIGAEPSRLSRLRQDLAVLGYGLDALAAAPYADAAILPPMDDIAAALGCAWVVEGSALGGEVLSRQLGAILGATRAGGRFLAFQPQQPERWRQCCAAIEDCGIDEQRRAAMVAAAVATFAAVETWLRP
jgi:heme oxygenase